MKLNLGNQIRLNRLRMNLTQEELAEKFGTSPQSVSRWENGTTYPDIEMLPMIASFFEMSLDALLGCTEEEKKKFCEDLQNKFKAAAREKNIEKTVELMREIRRNLREYQDYWFWGLYHELWCTRLFHNESVLAEMRLLTEEIFRVCPRDTHFTVIEQMADMEDDEHIDAFLDAYSSRDYVDRSALLFNRYKMREELDKIEPVRQYVLWHQLEHILSVPNDWQEYLCKDPNHFIWYCETQLNYLNAVNCLKPDSKHIISGWDKPDLWCEARVLLGIRYTASFSKLGEMDKAYDAFEDTIRVIERVMAIPEDEFELSCSSPALKGFNLKSNFCWLTDEDGREYKNLYMEKNEWANWIYPVEYQKAFQHSWFDNMRADARFDSLFERLDKCVISRDKIAD